METTKCAGCKDKISITKVHKMGDKEYCPSCYKTAQQIERERRHLIVYINEIFKISKPTGMMFAQMKRYNKSGLDYKTIRLTLKYLYEEEKFRFDPKYGIAIVAHRYNDAIDFYRKKMAEMKQVESVDYQTNEIKMSIDIGENKYVQSKMIDIEDIIGGDSVE